MNGRNLGDAIAVADPLPKLCSRCIGAQQGSVARDENKFARNENKCDGYIERLARDDNCLSDNR